MGGKDQAESILHSWDFSVSKVSVRLFKVYLRVRWERRREIVGLRGLYSPWGCARTWSWLARWMLAGWLAGARKVTNEAHRWETHTQSRSGTPWLLPLVLNACSISSGEVPSASTGLVDILNTHELSKSDLETEPSEERMNSAWAKVDTDGRSKVTLLTFAWHVVDEFLALFWFLWWTVYLSAKPSWTCSETFLEHTIYTISILL